MRVAVFDKRQRLIGAREVVKPKKGDVPCGDLPADGTYYHNGATFVPVGFGHGKPRRPDVDRDRAVYLLIKALLDGTPVPQECRNWCGWYEKHNRSEEHTSELQSLMRISYAVFCLKKKTTHEYKKHQST